jgi:F-type H+-transporting ATPase subunit alpha
MMGQATLARPYARAAFAQARENGAIEAWAAHIAFAAAVAGDARRRACWATPVFPRASWCSCSCPRAWTPRSPFGRFLSALIENRRLVLLPEIAAAFAELKREHERVLQVTVRSAVALDGEAEQVLLQALKRRFGREIELRQTIDESLIGGAVIDAGAVVIDGSVRGRLERMQEHAAPVVSQRIIQPGAADRGARKGRNSMATTLNPSEISELIKTRIGQFQIQAESRNEGTLVSVSDGIVRIHGLADAMAGEMIELPGNAFALVLNLERDSVGAVVLGDYEHLREGDTVKTTGRILEVPVGPGAQGPRGGRARQARSTAAARSTRRRARRSRRIAPGVIWRKSVSQPVQTGYKTVDAMIPLGRGQRELIIGDRQTGKTALAIDAIINQKNSGITCVYVAIGQKSSSIANVVRRSKPTAPWPHTIVVAATASESAAMQYIAPYSAAPWASTSATAARTR